MINKIFTSSIKTPICSSKYLSGLSVGKNFSNKPSNYNRGYIKTQDLSFEEMDKEDLKTYN
jgi:hypothetical protein